MEIDNPILRSENGVTEVAYLFFMSENGVMEVANPILTIKIGIMEVVIKRVRGHGKCDRKFITQKKVLEIAIPIFTPLNEVREVAVQVFTSQLTNLEVLRKTTSTSIPKPEYD